MYETLARDPIWQVRQAASRNLGLITSHLPDDSKSIWATSWFETFIADHSKNVRESTWETIGQVAAAFQPGEVKPAKGCFLML